MSHSYAQDCAEYPEIDGSECVSCVPDGWSIINNTSPDIIGADGSWPGPVCSIGELSGPSPGGGNMVLFYAAQTFWEEGMTTTLSDLDPSIEYSFGVYWEMIDFIDCSNSSEGSFLIEIDGEEYEYSGADDWELIELCFTPSSSSVDITLSIIGETDEFYAIVVDSPDCDMVTPCCALIADVDEEALEVCPGEEITLPGFYEREEGTVLVEWTSDPADGVSFLDDPYAIKPVFLVDNIEDFEGESYVFTLKVEDDNCERTAELEIEVSTSEVPEFEIFICEAFEDYVLPQESDNGYTGYWSGDFDFEDLGGTVQDYVFTLDAGQDNCITEWTYVIPIEEIVPLSFEIQDQYCVLDDSRHRLPDSSEERIDGEWSDDRIIPSELGTGIHSYYFYPDLSEHCADVFEFEFEVRDPDALSFNLPLNFCLSLDTFYLPELSNEMIAGEWSKDFIVLEEAGQFELEFVPERETACFENYRYTYSVGGTATASFNLPDTICLSEQIFKPQSQSLESYEGRWYPEEVLLDTLSTNIFSMRWVPQDSFNTCLSDTVLYFFAQHAERPVFDLPDTLCQAHGSFALPPISINGLGGAWEMELINTQDYYGEWVTLNFATSTKRCALNFSDSIFIESRISPQFDLNYVLCQNDPAFEMPTQSLNGIEGQWSTSYVNPSEIDDSLRISFTPNAGFCANEIDVLFTVNGLISAEFILPEFLCASDDGFEFPTLSANGVEGHWEIPVYDPESYRNLAQIENRFVPYDTLCYAGTEVQIPILDFSILEMHSLPSESCQQGTGSIVFEYESKWDVQFSINNGFSWTDDRIYNGLTGGDYDILARFSDFNSCAESFSFSIEEAEAVEILELFSNDPSSCTNNDGRIEIFAQGENLEYSLDRGISWQSSFVFSQLQPGSYTVLVRNESILDCTDSLDIILNEFQSTLILDSELIGLSDCNASDAQIILTAEGESLEYNIGGSLSWQTDPVFAGLDEGHYIITARSQEDPECMDEISISIESLPLPSIQEIITIDISDCHAEDGQIELLSMDGNYEYSIDDGLNWQDDPRFESLAPGDYTVLVRDPAYPSCFIERELGIEDLGLPVLEALDLIDATDCISNDATLLIQPMPGELLEYSINGGLDWQSEAEYSDLAPGNYELLFRPIDRTSCVAARHFEIERPECPCNELEYAFQLESPNCLDAYSGTIEIIDLYGFYTSEDFEVIWDNGDQGLEISELDEGMYGFTIRYDLNCSLTDSINLESLEPISFDLLSYDQDCEGLGIIEVHNLSGGSGDFLFSIDDVNFQDNSVFFELSADEYQVLVQDAFQCEATGDATISDVGYIELELPSVQPIERGESVWLNPLINETSIDSFKWESSGEILNPGELIAEAAPLTTSEYTLWIYFGNCIEVRSIVIEVLEPKDIYLPNIFQAGSSGNNAFFFPFGSEYLEIDIEALNIYDRWGNLVFENSYFPVNAPEEGWDGRFNGKPAEQGVYNYIMRYERDNRLETAIGMVTVVR